MTNNSSRVGKLGASQISFIREYKDALLEKKVINSELFKKFESLAEYLPTRYSEAHVVEFDEKQLADFQALKEKNDKKKAMQRGKLCEDMVMDQWLNENEDWRVIDKQVRLERNLIDVEIDLIVTIDFIVQNHQGQKKIVEVKTKDLDPSNDWSVNAWEKLKADGCPFQHVLQVNMQALFSGIHEMEVITAAVITITEGKGKNKTYKYQISENFTNKFTFDPMIGAAITQSIVWFDHELKTPELRDELFRKSQEEKTKADFEIDAFIEDFTATKEAIANSQLSKKISRYQELKPFIQEFKTLEEDLKSEIKQIMGLSRKLKLRSNSFEIEAQFTKPSFFDEEGILAGIKKAELALEDAKKMEIGTAKSRPSLRWVINSKQEAVA